jgi:hypothetical protein
LSAARSAGGALDVMVQETGGTAASDGAASTSLCRRRHSPAVWRCGLDVDVQEATDCWVASGGTAWTSPCWRRCTAGRRLTVRLGRRRAARRRAGGRRLTVRCKAGHRIGEEGIRLYGVSLCGVSYFAWISCLEMDGCVIVGM